jgi:hypothetical protein
LQETEEPKNRAQVKTKLKEEKVRSQKKKEENEGEKELMVPIIFCSGTQGRWWSAASASLFEDSIDTDVTKAHRH